MIADLHAHILPGADSACPDLRTAQRHLKRAARAGVTHIAAASEYDPTTTLPEDFLRRRDEAFAALAGIPEAQPLTLSPCAEVIWCPGLEKLSALESLTLGTGNLLVRVQPGESALAVAESAAALQTRLHGEILLTNADALPAEEAQLLFSAGARCILPLASLADRERRASLLPWVQAGFVLGIGSTGGERVRPYRGLRKVSRKLGRDFDALMRAAAEAAWPEETIS